jgi:small subunit ribosomal protein S8
MINYKLADLVSRLNTCKKESFFIQKTKDNLQFLQALNYLGIIKEIKTLDTSKLPLIYLEVFILPREKTKISVVSKPGRRIYSGYKELGSGSYIIRTSKGILTSHTALKLKLGGEILARIA